MELRTSGGLWGDRFGVGGRSEDKNFPVKLDVNSKLLFDQVWKSVNADTNKHLLCNGEHSTPSRLQEDYLLNHANHRLGDL